MKRGVIYARYSCDNQTEQSIEGQLRACQEYAAKHHIKIVDYYIDRAMTGTNDNRPDFQRMLSDSNTAKWNCILVYKFDRFSRNKYESVIHKKRLKDMGISVISAMENIPDSPEGIILESLLEGLNQYYSAELSQKVLRGMRETRIKGNYPGGRRPYGYNLVDRKLVINKQEAKTIRFIFEEYSLGTPCDVIIKMLNKKGQLYKTRKFRDNDLYRIIDAEFYTGVYYKHSEYFNKVYPQIIDRALYKKVANIRDGRRYGRFPGGHIYEYRNKIYCGKCGSVYRIDSGTSRHGSVIKYYRCVNSRLKHNCNAITLRKEPIEDYLTSALKDFFSKDDNIDNVAKLLMDAYREKNNIDLCKEYSTELFHCDKKLKQLIKIIEKDEFNEQVQEEIDILNDRIKELKMEIEYEKNKESCRHTIPFIKNFYIKSRELTSIKFVYYLVDKIVAGDNNFDIYLENPYNDKFKVPILVKSFNWNRELKLIRNVVKTDMIINLYL